MSKGVAVINLFKYRSLALGCSAFLIMLYVSFYMTVVGLIAVSTVAISLSLLCWLVYRLRNNKFTLDIFMKVCCITIFIVLAIIISIFTFQKDKNVYKYCDGSVYEIEGTVDEALFDLEYFGGYSISVNTVNGERCKFKATVTDNSASLKKNDAFKGSVVFSSQETKEVGFSSARYYLDKGILIDGEILEYTEISQGKSGFIDTLRSINEFLDKIIMDNFDEKSYPVISALLLGNRGLLSNDVSRDFTRLGIIHILSLSGMHVSIIVTMLGFALSKSFLPSSVQFIFISFFVVLFVGVSGFSEPAVRAGLMQILFFSIYIFWSRPDKITVLFVSVTLICIFSPYLVFSIGLLLSFLAMLGCMLSAKLIYRLNLMRKIRSKPLRFCFLTFTTTTSVTLLCLPLTYIYFGSFSLVSFLANVILVPIINVVIYLVPILLLILPVKFISRVLIYFCEVICHFVLDISSFVANLENLLLPVYSPMQLAGAVLLFISVTLVFILPRKKIKISLCAVLVSLLIFLLGTVLLFVNRNNNDYITAYSYNSNDVICIEEKNQLCVIDISDHSKSTLFSRDMSAYLGHGEIEDYVMLTYNNKSLSYLDKTTGVVVIRHMFLAEPSTENEHYYFEECIKLLESKEIEYTVFSKEITLGGYKLDMNEDLYVGRSTKRCVSFSLTKGDFVYSYFGASSYEVNTEETDERASKSDVLVFGAYGANYKKEYKYDIPNMDYCIFLGGSEEYAQEDFYESINNKTATTSPFKVRIKN